MKKVLITFLSISFLIGQTNPIDIATTGANKLRMHGQLNIFQNPATLGYQFNQIKIDSSYNEVSLNDLNENLTIGCLSESIQILELQRQGKNKQTTKEFLLGKKINKGTVLV